MCRDIASDLIIAQRVELQGFEPAERKLTGIARRF